MYVKKLVHFILVAEFMDIDLILFYSYNLCRVSSDVLSFIIKNP